MTSRLAVLRDASAKQDPKRHLRPGLGGRGGVAANAGSLPGTVPETVATWEAMVD